MIWRSLFLLVLVLTGSKSLDVEATNQNVPVETVDVVTQSGLSDSLQSQAPPEHFVNTFTLEENVLCPTSSLPLGSPGKTSLDAVLSLFDPLHCPPMPRF